MNMYKIKVVFIICIVIMLVLATYVVFQNRDSEKIWSNVISASLIASIGILSTTIFTLKSESSFASSKIFTVFDIDSRNLVNLDFELPWRQRKLMGFQPYGLEVENRYLNDNTFNIDSLMQDKFILEYLEKLIFNKLWEMFNSGSWQVTKVNANTGKFRMLEYRPNFDYPDATFISRDRLAEITGNRYMDSTFGPRQAKDGIYLPPKSTITARREARFRVLKVSNEFISMTIKIELLSSEINYGGSLKTYVKCNLEDAHQYVISNYELSIDTELEKIRTGHPKMNLYRNWVALVENELTELLDQQRYIDAGVIR